MILYKKNLKDSLFSCVWEITKKCNYNCYYCGSYSDDPSQYDMDMDHVKRTIQFLNRLDNEYKPMLVTLYGGEPTVNPLLPYILEELHTSRISLYTNLSQNIEYYDNIINIIKAKKEYVRLSTSIHRHQMKSLDDFCRKILLFNDAKIDIMMNVMMEQKNINHININDLASVVKELDGLQYVKKIRCSIPEGEERNLYEKKIFLIDNIAYQPNEYYRKYLFNNETDVKVPLKICYKEKNSKVKTKYMELDTDEIVKKLHVGLNPLLIKAIHNGNDFSKYFCYVLKQEFFITCRGRVYACKHDADPSQPNLFKSYDPLAFEKFMEIKEQPKLCKIKNCADNYTIDKYYFSQKEQYTNA